MIKQKGTQPVFRRIERLARSLRREIVFPEGKKKGSKGKKTREDWDQERRSYSV